MVTVIHQPDRSVGKWQDGRADHLRPKTDPALHPDWLIESPFMYYWQRGCALTSSYYQLELFVFVPRSVTNLFLMASDAETNFDVTERGDTCPEDSVWIYQLLIFILSAAAVLLIVLFRKEYFKRSIWCLFTARFLFLIQSFGSFVFIRSDAGFSLLGDSAFPTCTYLYLFFFPGNVCLNFV